MKTSLRTVVMLCVSILTAAMFAVVGGPAQSASASILGDDYPAYLRNAGQDSLIDPWRFYNRECTSFVAWRLNNTNHVAFNDYYRGPLWGNANNWGNAARAVGIAVNNTPAVGSVAWSTAGTYGHVAWVANVYGDGTIDIEQYNASYTGAYSSAHVRASSFTGFIHIADLNPASEGSFVSYQGFVYRIAGGAPIYVSTWNAFGGGQPTTALSDAQWASLRSVPTDGTFIRGTATGQVFRIAGGAPVYVSTWSAFGGGQPYIDVDQAAIDNAGQGAPWSHLNYRPADGTFVVGAQRGEVYRFAGGAPVYVSTWSAFGGAQPATTVDIAALDSAGQGAPWSHVNYRPADGTFVVGAQRGEVYRFAGGAPVYVSTWSAFGGQQPATTVDIAALDSAGQAPPWSHVNYRPADGTFLTAAPSGRVYQVTGGIPRYIANWSDVGGQHPTTAVDQFAIDYASAGGALNHLASAAPVLTQTSPSAPFSLGSAAPVRWMVPFGQASAVSTYDVRWKRAAFNGTFSAWQYPASWTGVTSPGVTYNGITAGWNYCYSVRAHNRAGQISNWSPARCVARPLDDTSLSVSTGWTRQSSTMYYGGSLLSTTRLNATVSRSGAVVDRIGLLATTCPNCGTVGVYVNGGLFRTVSLTSATIRHDVLIALPAFSLRTATITVKVLTSGRTVQIDGLAVSRS